MAETKWYYSQADQRFGPVSWDELKQLANSGSLKPNDLVWHQGLPQWVPAHTVQALCSGSEAPPPISPPLPPHPSSPSEGDHSASQKGRQAVKKATEFASKVLSEGTDHMRLSFAGAFPRVLGNAKTSLGALIAHPLLISLYSMTFLLAAYMSLCGIVTAVFFPMFLMGYLVIIEQHLSGQPINMAEFISFMRHGWNSLWHLAMLLASFLVTLSVMVAPFLIAGLLSFYMIGTVLVLFAGPESSGYPQPDSSLEISDTSMYSMDSIGESTQDDGLLFGFLDSTVLLMLQLLGLIMLVLLIAPVYSAIALFFYLVFDVAGSNPSSESKFDLVYDSFGRMLLIGKSRWPELVLSGLLLAVLCIGFPAVLGILDVLSERILAPALASWLFIVISSLGALMLAVYGNLFVATMCIELRKDMKKAD